MDFSLIIEILLQQQDSLPDYENLYQFTTSFYQYWLKLGRLVQEQLIQSESVISIIIKKELIIKNI